MALPDSYLLNIGSTQAYFEAILNAEPPPRFTQSFLEGLEFKSTNDRMLIGVLRDLGFLTSDRVPTERYFEFLDRSKSQRILAEGVRDAYSDLFRVNRKAHEMTAKQVKNRLRTLYKGEKKDLTISRIANTFVALCEYADFSSMPEEHEEIHPPPPEDQLDEEESAQPGAPEHRQPKNLRPRPGSVALDSLQYHINIVLPESRDQGVYDAIFKSLVEHLPK